MKTYSILKVASCYSLILLSSYGIFAQSTIYGTLSETDSIEIYALGNQAFSLRRSNPDSALLLANQALAKSEKQGNLPSQVIPIHLIIPLLTLLLRLDSLFFSSFNNTTF